MVSAWSRKSGGTLTTPRETGHFHFGDIVDTFDTPCYPVSDLEMVGGIRLNLSVQQTLMLDS